MINYKKLTFIFVLVFLLLLSSCIIDPNSPMYGETIHKGLPEGVYFSYSNAGTLRCKYMLMIKGEHEDMEGSSVQLDVYIPDPISGTWKNEPAYFYRGKYTHGYMEYSDYTSSEDYRYHVDYLEFNSCTVANPAVSAYYMGGRIAIIYDRKTAADISSNPYGSVLEPVIGTAFRIISKDYGNSCEIGRSGIWTRIQ